MGSKGTSADTEGEWGRGYGLEQLSQTKITRGADERPVWSVGGQMFLICWLTTL